MDGWMDGRMDGWMDGWTDGWMDGRTDGRTDGRMDGFQSHILNVAVVASTSEVHACVMVLIDIVKSLKVSSLGWA
jgi:hypothetical protein